MAGGDTRAVDEGTLPTLVSPPPQRHASAQRRLWQWRGWRRWWRLARGCSAGEGFPPPELFGKYLVLGDQNELASLSKGRGSSVHFAPSLHV